MDKELLDAIEVVETKLRGLREHFDSVSSQVQIATNKKNELDKEIKKLLQDIENLNKERSDLQFLIDAKKKENDVKAIAIKQAMEEIQRRTDVLDMRESNLDSREARIKDREHMYRIKPEG